MSRALRLTAALFASLLFVSACGGDDAPSEAEAIDLLTKELVTSAQLPEADAKCVATDIVEEIGVSGLAEIGVKSGGSGDFTELSAEDQAKLVELITASFGTCKVATN